MSLLWPQKADTSAWWEEEDCQEYIQQHFSIKHIAEYFRTRLPVSAADIDGWRARELMAPLFMGEDDELQGLMEVSVPSSKDDHHAAKAGVAVSPASPPTLSGGHAHHQVPTS